MDTIPIPAAEPKSWGDSLKRYTAEKRCDSRTYAERPEYQAAHTAAMSNSFTRAKSSQWRDSQTSFNPILQAYRDSSREEFIKEREKTQTFNKVNRSLEQNAKYGVDYDIINASPKKRNVIDFKGEDAIDPLANTAGNGQKRYNILSGPQNALSLPSLPNNQSNKDLPAGATDIAKAKASPRTKWWMQQSRVDYDVINQSDKLEKHFKNPEDKPEIPLLPERSKSRSTLHERSPFDIVNGELKPGKEDDPSISVLHVGKRCVSPEKTLQMSMTAKLESGNTFRASSSRFDLVSQRFDDVDEDSQFVQTIRQEGADYINYHQSLVAPSIRTSKGAAFNVISYEQKDPELAAQYDHKEEMLLSNLKDRFHAVDERIGHTEVLEQSKKERTSHKVSAKRIDEQFKNGYDLITHFAYEGLAGQAPYTSPSAPMRKQPKVADRYQDAEERGGVSYNSFAPTPAQEYLDQTAQMQSSWNAPSFSHSLREIPPHHNASRDQPMTLEIPHHPRTYPRAKSSIDHTFNKEGASLSPERVRELEASLNLPAPAPAPRAMSSFLTGGKPTKKEEYDAMNRTFAATKKPDNIGKGQFILEFKKIGGIPAGDVIFNRYPGASSSSSSSSPASSDAALLHASRRAGEASLSDFRPISAPNNDSLSASSSLPLRASTSIGNKRAVRTGGFK